MAFVFKHERFTEEQKDISDAFYVGPETYTTKKNVAPFNSTAPRVPEKKEKKEKEIDHESFFRILDMKKELVYKKVRETKKRKKVTQSIKPRFRESEYAELGPGAYNPYDYESFEFARKTEKPSIVKRRPVQKPPAIVRSSIPYKRRDSDEDLPIEERSILMAAGTNSKIGPGAYNTSVSVNTNGVVSWQRTKPKKLLTEELMTKQNPSIGPGAYNPKYEYSLQYKEKELSAFVPKKSCVKNKETSNCEYVKGAIPGPGHYNPKIGSVPIKNKKKKFEIFGVSVPRFAINYNDLTAVGPGSYNIDKDMLTIDFYNTKVGNMNFGETKQRFDSIRENTMPGPGTYIDKIDLIKTSYNRKMKFIEQTERFKERKEQPESKNHQPEFEIVRVINSKKEKPSKFRLKQKPSIPFMSKKNRQNFEDNKEKLPAVGAYDLKIHDISYQITRNSFAKSKDMAFLSKSTRFKSEKKLKEADKENSFTVDNQTKSIFRDLPTYHDYPTSKNQIKSSAFKSRAQRFEGDRKLNYRFYGQRPEWNIKSFNIHF